MSIGSRIRFFIAAATMLGVVLAGSARASDTGNYNAAQSEHPAANAVIKLTPELRQWLLAEIAKARIAPNFTAQSVRDDANAAVAVFGTMSYEDISALLSFVMMQASKSAQDDLQAIMIALKKINSQKDIQRIRQEELNNSKRTLQEKLKKVDTNNTAVPCPVKPCTSPSATPTPAGRKN